MIKQFLTSGLEIPAAFIFFNLMTFLVLKATKQQWIRPLERITLDWIIFMKRGIPVPADYRRIDTPFIGEPVLAQPVLQIQNSALAKR